MLEGAWALGGVVSVEVARAQIAGGFSNPHQNPDPFGAALRVASRGFCAAFGVGGLPASPEDVAPSALNRATRDGAAPLSQEADGRTAETAGGRSGRSEGGA